MPRTLYLQGASHCSYRNSLQWCGVGRIWVSCSSGSTVTRTCCSLVLSVALCAFSRSVGACVALRACFGLLMMRMSWCDVIYDVHIPAFSAIFSAIEGGMSVARGRSGEYRGVPAGLSLARGVSPRCPERGWNFLRRCKPSSARVPGKSWL